ncbi:dihydroorotase [Candidatus Viridilinea mediisalina]|uniref:Dihydroorotase n=1 Tax=Candidatus Viridilinea mediisalina TaxID=2024553 RepID=A0A2A6RM75_9CHLR|nr:dihydroorotase [Candidatus Viridilinea mediisalina]PDW04006.1 dihydroorotase [Candidatus Viridilinea mediisalina]
MEITLHAPLDMHLHLREGAMLQTVAPLSARDFAAAVVMPNLVPPVTSLERLLAYREAIVAAAQPHQFLPLMTLFFQDYDEASLRAARPHIIGVKLYPDGVTTNSAGGVSDLAAVEPTLALLERLAIPLLVHGESHGFVLDREAEFLPVYERWAQRFPQLTIVMEHITTAGALQLLQRYPNLAATVTLHHLLITLDDVAGGLLCPHLFCKPIAKRPEDREALLAAALAAQPRLMFGSDSAPHPVDRKEAAGCAAGVFTAPVILPLLVDLFARHHALERLQAFVSDNARAVYGFTPPAKPVTLRQEAWQVPARYGTVVPFYANQTLAWRVEVPRV